MKMWKSKTLILLHVVLVLMLAQSALAALKNEFPIFPLPEEVPPESQDGRSIYRGPVNEDLYPAVQRPAPIAQNLPSFKAGTRPTLVAADMARGRDGALVPGRPYALRLSPETKPTGWRGLLPNWKTGGVTSSTEQMQQLLRERRPLEAVYNPTAVPDTAALSRPYYSIKLPGNGRDAEVLKMMQKKGKPFYTVGAKGKVFYFDTKDGKSWTFTDKVSDADRQGVSANLEQANKQYQAAVAAEAEARARVQNRMLARQQAARAARAAMVAREGAASSSSWLQKIKGWFGSAPDVLRPIHV
jgi:hypothetical protein